MSSPAVCRVGHAPETLFGRAVLVDKPGGWSSFDVVKKIRVLTDERKVGHAGSLDPLATGLLICCVGRPATREIQQFMDLDKEYVGTMRFGEVTSSYDAETEVIERHEVDALTERAIRREISSFVGPLDQKPPMYSAVKVEGEPLYEKARRGEEVERPVRRVRVDRFELISFDGRDARFEVECSKGTYVRSLVHDLGRALEVGAHVRALRRTAIGSYRVEDAFTIEALEELVTTDHRGSDEGSS